MFAFDPDISKMAINPRHKDANFKSGSEKLKEIDELIMDEDYEAAMAAWDRE